MKFTPFRRLAFGQIGTLAVSFELPAGKVSQRVRPVRRGRGPSPPPLRGRRGTKPIPRQVGAATDTVWSMPEWKKGWKPATVGEAREYLDAHERDGDPAIIRACEAKVDATVHRSEPGRKDRGRRGTAPVAKPPLEQLEEKGAD